MTSVNLQASVRQVGRLTESAPLAKEKPATHANQHNGSATQEQTPTRWAICQPRRSKLGYSKAIFNHPRTTPRSMYMHHNRRSFRFIFAAVAISGALRASGAAAADQKALVDRVEQLVGQVTRSKSGE